VFPANGNQRDTECDTWRDPGGYRRPASADRDVPAVELQQPADAPDFLLGNRELHQVPLLVRKNRNGTDGGGRLRKAVTPNQRENTVDLVLEGVAATGQRRGTGEEDHHDHWQHDKYPPVSPRSLHEVSVPTKMTILLHRLPSFVLSPARSSLGSVLATCPQL